MKLNRGEPDHPHWKTPFTPKEKAAAWLGIGGCFIALGVMEWINPSRPPFAGRWSWLTSATYNTFGIHGQAVLYGVIGALLVVAGCVQWARDWTPRAR